MMFHWDNLYDFKKLEIAQMSIPISISWKTWPLKIRGLPMLLSDKSIITYDLLKFKRVTVLHLAWFFRK